MAKTEDTAKDIFPTEGKNVITAKGQIKFGVKSAGFKGASIAPKRTVKKGGIRK